MQHSDHSHSVRPRTDLRVLDHHESWRGVYALLDVEPSIEPESHTDSGVAASEVST